MGQDAGTQGKGLASADTSTKGSRPEAPAHYGQDDLEDDRVHILDDTDDAGDVEELEEL